MSAEIENNKEEDIKEPMRPLYLKLLDHWQIGFKLLQLMFCIICITLAYEPLKMTGLGKSHLHHVGICYTAFTGYILIISILLLGRMLKDTLGYKTYIIISVSGAGLFLIAGTLLIADRSYLNRNMFYPQTYLLDMITACTIFAFINTIIFSVDAIMTFKWQENF